MGRWLRLLRRLVPGIQKDAQRVQRAQDQPDGGARFAFFDLDDPLSADAYFFGQSTLIETQLPAPCTNKGAQF